MTPWEEINPWNEGMHALSASPEKGESGGNRARFGVTVYPRTGRLSRRPGGWSCLVSPPGGGGCSPAPAPVAQSSRRALPLATSSRGGGPITGGRIYLEEVLGGIERLFDPADCSGLLVLHATLGLRYCRCNVEHQATVGVKFVRSLGAEHCHRRT